MEEKLTEREKMVLKELVAGKSNPEIAERLFITVHTVKIHLENIYRKLNVCNRVQAAVYAVTNKILDWNAKD